MRYFSNKYRLKNSDIELIVEVALNFVYLLYLVRSFSASVLYTFSPRDYQYDANLTVRVSLEFVLFELMPILDYLVVFLTPRVSLQ